MEEIWKLMPAEWRVENMYDHPKGKELERSVENAKALLEESGSTHSLTTMNISLKSMRSGSLKNVRWSGVAQKFN